MKITILAILCLTAFSALAYNPIIAEPDEVYSPIVIEGDPYVQREYLGSLDTFPDMYELTTTVNMTLKLQLGQRDAKSAVPFGLIMVRQNEGDGGVAEVVRVNEELSKWQSHRSSVLGVSLLQGSVIETELEPGTYRIEVSTPDNQGNYMLVVGEEIESVGFFEALGHIYVTQQHFGYTPFRMLFSSYVYYPIGILVVLYGIYATWQYRKGETPWLVRSLKRSLPSRS